MKKVLILFFLFLTIGLFAENTLNMHKYLDMSIAEQKAYAQGIAAGLAASHDLVGDISENVKNDNSIPDIEKVNAVKGIYQYMVLIEDSPELTANIMESFLRKVDSSEIKLTSEAIENIILNIANYNATN